jgi:hypothetical protein
MQALSCSERTSTALGNAKNRQTYQNAVIIGGRGEWRVGEWRVGSRRVGEWRVGEWRVGEWRVASGEWRVASGRVASGEWASGEWRGARGEIIAAGIGRLGYSLGYDSKSFGCRR